MGGNLWGRVSCGLVLMQAMAAGPAAAHVCLDQPVSRAGPDCSFRSSQKVGPCGISERSNNPTVFRPGETITVRIRETIDHPSHYRIAFNPEGDAFEDPIDIDDKDGDHPHVLLDGIEDAAAEVQEVEVTLPNVTCDTCTLQLIQVMYDKQGNGFGGNDGVPPDNDDLYYMCADIILRGDTVDGGTGAEAGVTDNTPAQGPDATVPSQTGPDAGLQETDDPGANGVVGEDASIRSPSELQPDAPSASSDDSGGCAVRPPRQGPGTIGPVVVALFALQLMRRRARQACARRAR
ncbi:MAG: hypothetical protein OXU20_13640 [Myxococcales bacterium]|nr:hypothetical protein [Myxococcales bacterium]